MSGKALQKCYKCDKNITLKLFTGISCVDCNKPWHWKCTDLSEQAIETVKENKLSWTCAKCKRHSTIFSGPVVSRDSEPLPSTSKTVPKPNRQKPSPASAPITISELSTEVSNLKQLLQTALLRIDTLEAQLTAKSSLVEKVSSEVHRLEVACDSIEKNRVDDNLEVQNLPESSLEDPLTTALDIGAAIGCNISEEDLKSAPFCDRKRLRLSFKSKTLRRQFLLSAKKFNRENKRFLVGSHRHKIHVNEELTAFQRKLFEQARVFKTANCFKFCWFGASGQLLLKKSENSPVHVIDSIDSLRNENLLSECERPSNQDSGMPSSSSS